MDESRDCPVCLAELSAQMTTPCGHTFCKRCIHAALASPEAPSGFGFCPVCRDFIATSSLHDGAIPQHGEADASPFGRVYVEHGSGIWAEGFDSYHFDDATTCCAHISYEGYDSAVRARFDDGSLPPKTKQFTDTSFDASRRCFRGTIDWAPRAWVFEDDSGSRHVEQRWVFEIYFAAGFGTISRGEVRDYNDVGELVATHRFGADPGWQYANRELPEIAQGGSAGGAYGACSGAAAAMVGEEGAAALREWIDEANPTLGEVLQRVQELRAARSSGQDPAENTG